MDLKEIIEREIAKWKGGGKRASMAAGQRYYRGFHDILKRQRTAIGEGGRPLVVDNLPNSRIVDNQYAKMVDQKVNYLLGKPLTISAGNGDFEGALRAIFDKRFHRLLSAVGRDCFNCGIGWIYLHYDAFGHLRMKRFDPLEVIPFWADSDHTELDMAVRLYRTEVCEGQTDMICEKAEVYLKDCIMRFSVDGSGLVFEGRDAYMSLEGQEFCWDRIPLVAYKAGAGEAPLIGRVKSLQDGINLMLSDFENNMLEDSRNTILVLKNYDGQNLGEFRRNLAAYGAVKVKTENGAEGGVEALKVEVNAANYSEILRLLKDALVENAMGFDAKSHKLSGAPNQMNILSMYSDIDLDAGGMETHFQAAMAELLELATCHIFNTSGLGEPDEGIEVIFNRDMLMNEAEIIENAVKSLNILSKETVISQHPWISDVKRELARIEEEQVSPK